ncbi:MAG: hypothetical protein FWG31_05955 [Oscillospiraceae bacterium]|nr:hypothetical protein [Oscillospiraceae bacterium]
MPVSRSSVGLQREIQTGGRDAGSAYCRAWQKEITDQGNTLNQLLRSQKIDNKTFNVHRLELNKQTQELNSCVAVLNKKT